MFGKLSLAAIPLNQPIVVGAMGFIALVVVAVLGTITWTGRWRWLWTEWLTSVDHKKIGVMYLLLALLMLLRGFSDAIMMRSQLAVATAGAAGYLPPEHYDQIFTAHGVIMIFFMAMPFVIGLMNIIVPLQIGARDVAFPFLNSLSFWLTVAGFGLVNMSLVVGEFARTGWLPTRRSPSWRSARGWASTTTSGACRYRASERRSRRSTSSSRSCATARRECADEMPVFTWTSLCSSMLICAAFPILTVSLALLTLDRYLGMHFFTSELGGNPMMYVNLIWVWGHPEVYILVLPAFGAFSEIIATFSASACSDTARW
jgi:cytochrome o ubiquinol oxidase subunit 1